MIYVSQNKNPLEYYRLASKRNFIKVLCVLPDYNDIKAFKSVLRTSKFEFEHNNHILSSNICDKWLIAKLFKYSTIIKGNYSLKNFSDYDAIWLIEKDSISLKKRLSKCFGQLPPDIPKLAIINGIETEVNKSFIFRNYGINIVTALHKPILSEIDKEKRKEIINDTIKLLKNPELGLTNDFVQEYVQKPDFNYPLIFGALAVGSLTLLVYHYYSKRKSN